MKARDPEAEPLRKQITSLAHFPAAPEAQSPELAAGKPTPTGPSRRRRKAGKQPPKQATQPATAGRESAILKALPANIALIDPKESLADEERKQRRLAEALTIETQRLHESQAVAKVGSWQTDLTTYQVSWTPETHRIFETNPDQFKPTHSGVLELIHPEDRSRVAAAFRESIGQPGQFAIEHRVRCHDGRSKYVEERWQCFSDASGRPVRAVGTCQDITERKLAEERLRSAEEKFRAIFENAVEGIFQSTPSGKYLALNPAFARIHGYESPAEMIRLVTDVARDVYVEPADREEFKRLLEERGSVAGFEHETYRKDRSRIWVSLSARVIADPAGGPDYYEGTIVDITDRKKNEEENRQAREALAGIVKAQQEVADATGTTEELLQLIVERAQILTGAAGATVELAAGEEMVVQAGSGTAAGRVGNRAPRAGSLAARAMDLRTVMSNPDAKGGPLAEPIVAGFSGMRSVVVAPVRAGDETIGVLTIFANCPHAFAARDANNLQILAETLGSAWHRRQSAETLRSSAAEFRNLAESMPQIVWTTDPAGRVTYFNQHWMAYTGLTPEASLDYGWVNAFHPEERAAAEATWQRAAAQPGTHALECRLRGRDGIYRWWLIRGIPQFTATGEVRNWFGTCTDIHDLKLAELEVQRTNRALQMLSACNEALIHSVDEQKLLEEVCRIAVENGGYRMASVGYLRSGADGDIEVMAHAGALVDCPFRIPLTRPEATAGEAAGEPGEQSLISLPLREGRKTFGLLGLCSFAGDRTGKSELKLLQELADDLAFGICHLRLDLERQKSAERLGEQAALLDAASDAIILKDMADRIIYWNRGAERMYGWTTAEALGKKSREFLFPDGASFDASLRTLMEQGQWQGEMEKCTREGKRIPVEVHWTLVRDEQGKPKSVLAINTDITDRKRIEAQFLRVKRLESIGTLASGIAHDLNNVLTPILMAVQILNESVREEERPLLDVLRSSALRGAELIKQVLAFARGVSGQRIPVNLSHIIRDVEEIIRDTFPKNIEFRCTPAAALWSVTGDATQLNQVLMNLCVNARDAMPVGGQLEINLSNAQVDEVYAGLNPDAQAGPHVLIRVKDSGEGIPKSLQDKIFEPFFTTKEIGKGTGLGLSTVLSIVKSHGGFIQLESAPGAGSEFRVYLPAHPAIREADEASFAEGQLPTGQGQLVLVVDDEPSVRLVVEKTLRRFGYRVLSAANGAEAVFLYSREGANIAVVLTDMAMPIMDGAATIAALQAMNPAVRIICSSGHAANADIEKAMQSGVKHFIPKPYSAKAILTLMAKVIAE